MPQLLNDFFEKKINMPLKHCVCYTEINSARACLEVSENCHSAFNYK